MSSTALHIGHRSQAETTHADEDLDLNKIYHCLWIETPVERVHAALTDRAGLSGWWTKDVEHSGETGSVSTFRFSSGAFNKMKIVSSSPEQVEWECVDGHDEWIGTRITFQLR
jgi:uncharacterized protein YndB with AHSA1/START domain